MNWYIAVLKKYAVFSGRAQRKEYWMFVLFNIIFSILCGVIDGVLGTFDPKVGIGVVGGIYALAVLLPSIAVGVRRLHDTSRSGWWLLIAFLPIIGPLVLIIFFVRDSVEGDNDYGPNPKAAPAQA